MALASQNSNRQCNQFRKQQQQRVNPNPFCDRLKISRKDRCYRDAAGNRDQPITRTRAVMGRGENAPRRGNSDKKSRQSTSK